jgi:hypothetical protein
MASVRALPIVSDEGSFIERADVSVDWGAGEGVAGAAAVEDVFCAGAAGAAGAAGV